MTSRAPRDILALTRELRTATAILCSARTPRSGVRVPSLRLRLHVPDLPPSPCSSREVGDRAHEREVGVRTKCS
jgi:hypothetical protein